MVKHTYIEGAPTPNNALTKDHLEPRTYGGPTTPENIVAACCLCNNLRGEIDATSFSNLLRKWFKQDPTLRDRWHSISKREFREFKLRCMSVHERQLRGLGIRSIESAFRHFKFIRCHHRKFELQQA
jgi:hypothetical protein